MRSTEGTANDRAPLDGVDRTMMAGSLDSRIVADLGGTRVLDDGDARSRQPDKPQPRWGLRLVIGLVVAAILWAGLTYGAPYVRELRETVQTNDAFVAGHITYVSPRIEDIVTEVLVDQDDGVEPGQLLLRLDRQPFELTVAQDEAALEQARARLVQARAQVKSQVAQARGAYYQRKNQQEAVRQQVATLIAQVATLKSRQASLQLARNNLRRARSWRRAGASARKSSTSGTTT